MGLTFYSGLMAVIWFSIFAAIGNILRNKTGFLLHYSVYSLLGLSLLSMIRLLVPIEFGFTKVINANAFFTGLFDAIASPLPLPLPLEISVSGILLLLWLLVALYLIARFLSCIRHDRQILQMITPIEDRRIAECLEEIVQGTRPRKKYKLIVSDDITVPMLVGIIGPTVLVPRCDMSDGQLYCLLAHEWQHVLNRDPWIKLFVSLVRCVMWWIPPVWTMEKNVEDVLESRCDLALTKGMGRTEKLTYLKTLCLTYERASHCNRQNSFAFASSFVRRESDRAVIERFELVSKHRKGVKSTTAAFLLVVTLSFAFSYLFVIQPNHEIPVDVPLEQVFHFTPDNAYIRVVGDGEYELFYENRFFLDLSADDIKYAPFDQLPMVRE